MLALLGAVLAVHVALLGTWPRTPGPGWQAQPAVSVRQIVVVPVGAVAPAPLHRPAPNEPTARTASPGAAAMAPVASKPAPPVVMAAPVSAEALPAADADPGGVNVPTYATLPPPPARLRYETQRGGHVGEAELDWRPSDAGYELTLRGGSGPGASRSSHGAFDAAGLAPLRHTESRRGRERHAVNFQRDSGRVTFSGPGIEHALVPGAQDRLSWMLQLAAVLNANPQLAQPDAQVQLWVAGPRGDGELWTFTVMGRGELAVPAGTVADAVHLLREPRRAYDTQAQVWLDPARAHLPVRLLLRVRAGAADGGTEFRLLEHGP